MKPSQIFLGLFALALMSCGGGESPKTETTTAPPKSMIEAEAPEDAELGNVGEIQISGDDQMKYNKTELRAKAGEEVTVVLTHTGKLPLSAMGHNFVLLKKGTDMADFANRAMAAAENDYIPEGDEVIAHTKTIGGGENTSVTFTAPAPGTYQYLCTFPGHYALMNGKFIVE